MKKNISKILIIIFVLVIFSFTKETVSAELIHEPDGNGGVTGYVNLSANYTQGEIVIDYGGSAILSWNVLPFTNKYLATMNLTQYLEGISCSGTGGLFVIGSYYKGTDKKTNLTSSQNYGITCTDTFGNKGSSQVKVTVKPKNLSKNLSGLFVLTDDATNITYTTAKLNGTAGDTMTNPTLPMTAYFRYSKAAISPIFCNDIYGTNMLSTKDIVLGATKDKNCVSGGVYPKCIPPASESFWQNITNLLPDTTYYYCAIISNKENIAYEGSNGTNIVKSFHTSPYGTNITTKNVTNVASTSVTLNGYYSSIDKVTTYFQYRKVTNDNTTPDWTTISYSSTPHNVGSSGNVYGVIKTDLTGLTPSTSYQFRAVGTTNSSTALKNHSDTESKTIYGSALNFTTSSIAGDGSGTGGTVNSLAVSVKASPTSVDSGGTSVISWTSTSAQSCIDEDGIITGRSTRSGSFTTEALTNGRYYSITCTDANGLSKSGRVYVSVKGSTNPVIDSKFPTVNATASPTSVDSGGTSVISWTSTNALYCSDGDGLITGRSTRSGSFTTEALTRSRYYSITCTGEDGTETGHVYVAVNNDGTNLLTDRKVPIVTVKATPASINSGETSVISWTSTYANSCSDTEGHITGRSTRSGSFTTEALTHGRYYSVICTGDDGTSSGHVYVFINGDNGTITNNNLPNVTVTASPSSITSGESSTISWTSTNTTSCSVVNGDATLTSTSGSFNTGTLTKSKSYSVICSGDQGKSSGYAYVYIGNGNNNGENGTWKNGATSGTWRTTAGTMGDGSTVVWTGTGNGSGTWRSATGSGTWSNGAGTGGAGTGSWTSIQTNTNDTGIINTTPLTLGQTATPPDMDVVRYHEGIETVFTRQIMADTAFAKLYGYTEGNDLQTFAWDLADQLARMFGYVSTTGKEIRVSLPDVAAYQLQQIGDKLTVYEYYKNKIVDVRNATATLKSASGYEYYFKK